MRACSGARTLWRSPGSSRTTAPSAHVIAVLPLVIAMLPRATWMIARSCTSCSPSRSPAARSIMTMRASGVEKSTRGSVLPVASAASTSQSCTLNPSRCEFVAGTLAGPGPDRKPVEPAPQAAHGLADALLVLDQSEADEALAAGAEAVARRDGDLAVADQRRCEPERAELAVRLGDRRPYEHRPARAGDVPADALEPVAERVAARLVDLAHALGIGRILVHGDCRRDL